MYERLTSAADLDREPRADAYDRVEMLPTGRRSRRLSPPCVRKVDSRPVSFGERRGVPDLRFRELIDECEQRATSDERFVGSNEHLRLLEEFATRRVIGVRLTWADYSYSERLPNAVLFAIKRPSAFEVSSSAERVQLAAHYLVHEIHHALNSDHAALVAYERETFDRRSGPKGINPLWVVDLCNQLEDMRLLQRARRHDPADVESLETVNRVGFEINLRRYEASFDSAPWGQSPVSAEEQLTLAVTALVLLDRHFDVTTTNELVLRQIAPHIEAARHNEFSAVVAATEAITEIIENVYLGTDCGSSLCTP
jgi:hypothetical protein